MTYLGVIGGSNFLKSGYFASESFSLQIEETEHGLVNLYVNENDRVIFVQRHAADPNVTYSPPHLINKKAIIKALKQRNVERVLAFNSTGSMKRTLSIGTLVLPDDFICLSPITFFDDYRAHVVPSFDATFRSEILAELRSNGFNPVSEATYVQTNGPRFETKAEIALFATHSDIVGMTSAHEATLCQELGMAFASVCMIDNYANGISAPLTTDEFHKGVHDNLKTMEKVLSVLIAKFRPEGDFSADSTLKTKVSSLIHARWIVPVCPDNDSLILEHHSLAVNSDGSILDIIPTVDARKKYCATSVVDISKHHVVHPGLINGHTHLGMTMLRGYSDDKNLRDWLEKDIWPCEGVFANDRDGKRFVYDSARLGMAEMLRSGSTCFNDMYMVPRQTAEAAVSMGMRGIISFPVMDQPWLPDFEGQAKDGEAVREWLAGNPLLSIAAAPHAPYTVTDETFVDVREWNRSNTSLSADGSIMHVHLHETKDEVDQSIAGEGPVKHRSDQRTSPLINLARLNVLDNKTVAVHMTTLTDEEIEILAQRKVNVIHCPCSNLKLASGFCPVAKLLSAGINVGLGTDSTASNNGLDMYAEMKTAAILAKAVGFNPTFVPAAAALRMATYNNALAMGLEKVIGSLEVGKQADIVALEMDNIESLPIFNVLSQIVYTGSSRNVTDVWIAGKRMLRNRELVGIDIDEIKKAALKTSLEIIEFKKKQDEENGLDVEDEEKQ